MSRSRSFEATENPAGRPGPPPRVSVGVLIILGGLLFGCLVWVGVSGVQHLSAGGGAAARWASILFAVCWTVLIAVVIAGPAIQLRTQLGERFIAKPTLRGRTEIEWADVTTIQDSYPSILRISDGTHTINLAVWIYRDADALFAWIEARLRERGAPVIDNMDAAGRTDP